jgi:hypothetical protein
VQHVVGNEAETDRPPRVIEEWIRVAVEDAFALTATPFRAFLYAHGADLSKPRSGFKKLSEAYIDFTNANPEDWTDVLDSIASDFPQPTEALSLKRASITPTELASEESEIEREWNIINYLCLHGTNSAYADISLDFGSTFRRLWRKKRSDLVRLLSDRPPSEGQERWKQVAIAVAENIDESDLQWLGESQSDLLPLLINVRPELAISLDVWRMPERVQWRMVEALEAQDVTPEIWACVVQKMLEADTVVAAKEVSASAGQAALDGALRWLIGIKKKQNFPPLWREALRPSAEQRIQRAATSSVELALCVTLSSSKVAEKIPPTRKDVQQLATEPLTDLPSSLQLPVAFFLLTIGLQAAGIVGARLIGRSFFVAHAALAAEIEPPESWRLLQPHLPELWFWQQWDRCEMLRTAVRNWLKKNPAQATALLNNANSLQERKLAKSLIISAMPSSTD